MNMLPISVVITSPTTRRRRRTSRDSCAAGATQGCRLSLELLDHL